MDMLVIFVGFASIGGLLAGYLAGRFSRPVRVVALWVICAVILVAYVNWLDVDNGLESFDPIVVLYGILIPFSGCLVFASLIGVVAQRVLAEETAP